MKIKFTSNITTNNTINIVYISFKIISKYN